MKIGRYQETAIKILTAALLINANDITATDLTEIDKKEEAKKLKKLASEALSECGTEITMFDASISNNETFLFSFVTCNGVRWLETHAGWKNQKTGEIRDNPPC